MAKRWFLLLCVAGWAHAESPSPKPAPPDYSLWEAGLVGAIAWSPDYPAAAQNHFKWIVAPFGIYRGDVVRADRDGARARLIQIHRSDVDLSVAASFASPSKDNEARAGMPDLDYMLELGPRLSYGLSRLGGRGKLQLFLPIRAVFSTDLGDFQHRGFTLTPALNARWHLFRGSRALAIVQLSSTFGSRQLNAYYYDVAPGFALPDRAFYDARGGYIGSDLFVGMLLPLLRQLRMFVGGQYMNHRGAANEVSPLFKKYENYGFATGLIWTFFQSKKPAVTLD